LVCAVRVELEQKAVVATGTGEAAHTRSRVKIHGAIEIACHIHAPHHVHLDGRAVVFTGAADGLHPR
jgi:hypothetical protein